MDIGVKIKKVRELKNLTQEFVAEELGMSQSAYSKIENGENDLSFKKLDQIAGILGLKAEEIYNFNDQMAFYITHNHGLAGTGTVNNNFPDELKAAYEEQINQLKEQLKHLNNLMDKMLDK